MGHQDIAEEDVVLVRGGPQKALLAVGYRIHLVAKLFQLTGDQGLTDWVIFKKEYSHRGCSLGEVDVLCRRLPCFRWKWSLIYGILQVGKGISKECCFSTENNLLMGPAWE